MLDEFCLGNLHTWVESKYTELTALAGWCDSIGVTSRWGACWHHCTYSSEFNICTCKAVRKKNHHEELGVGRYVSNHIMGMECSFSSYAETDNSPDRQFGPRSHGLSLRHIWNRTSFVLADSPGRHRNIEARLRFLSCVSICDLHNETGYLHFLLTSVSRQEKQDHHILAAWIHLRHDNSHWTCFHLLLQARVWCLGHTTDLCIPLREFLCEHNHQCYSRRGIDGICHTTSLYVNNYPNYLFYSACW